MPVCPDCRTDFPETDGPVHEYLGGSAGCWKAYGEVLAREYGDFRYMAHHRWTVDAYAAQHPGKPEPRSIASVHLHLMALHLLLERKLEPAAVTSALQAVTLDRKRRLEWLTPPKQSAAVCVADILRCETPEQHGVEVRAWADGVWRSWSAHHEAIRRLALEFI